MRQPSVIVLGGGLSGIATALTLARAGLRDVALIERGSTLGGLAGSFERDGRFYPLGYHHILHRDRGLLYFLREIGALEDVRWRRIRMLFHVGRESYDLMTARGFLRFPMSLPTDAPPRMNIASTGRSCSRVRTVRSARRRHACGTGSLPSFRTAS